MRKLAWIISIIFFGFFTQFIILILNELGLFAVIELDEPILVSSYDDYYLEDSFTTPLGIAVYGIGFILSYWLFKFIDQKTLKITYEKKETEGSKDAASPNVLGHVEIFCFLPLLNKANASLPCLGSELTLTGIPNPKDSDNS